MLMVLGWLFVPVYMKAEVIKIRSLSIVSPPHLSCQGFHHATIFEDAFWWRTYSSVSYMFSIDIVHFHQDIGRSLF
jgi:hypothetical protein